MKFNIKLPSSLQGQFVYDHKNQEEHRQMEGKGKNSLLGGW